jgi:hypothetical protein
MMMMMMMMMVMVGLLITKSLNSRMSCSPGERGMSSSADEVDCGWLLSILHISSHVKTLGGQPTICSV